MSRRHRSREPATEGALLEPERLGDPSGLHTDDDDEIERLIDPEGRELDEATVLPHEHPDRSPSADVHVPEDMAREALTLATQGGGSFFEEDMHSSLEDHIDRGALGTGIVPQLVSQATLESSALVTDESEADEPMATIPSPARKRDRAASRKRIKSAKS